MGVLVAVITMIVVGGCTFYGVRLLTNNSDAGWAFGCAIGWFAYQTTLILHEIKDKLPKT